MHQHLDSFSRYCNSFLRDSEKGAQLFFIGEKEHSYYDLIQTALFHAEELIKIDDAIVLLKMESPYALFCSLLACVFADKKALITSFLEPENALNRLKEDVPFKRVLTDEDFSNVKSCDLTLGFTDADFLAPRFFLLSSGSSGLPKAIGLSLKNIFSSAQGLIEALKQDSSDTTFINLPHHHIGGLMIFWRAFLSSGKVTNLPGHDYTLLSLVPLQLKRYLKDETKVFKLKKCKAILIGGGILSIELKSETLKQGLALYETYGMTETSSLVLLNGHPLRDQEIRLDDDGHFQIKGPTLALGFYQKHVFLPLPVDQEHFYHTKDVGEKNADGSFSFRHRSDLLFKSAGELINPQLIEARVKELDSIAEAVVVPVKHHTWTHAAALIFSRKEGFKEPHDVFVAEIKAHLKKFLHPYLVPRLFFEKPLALMSAAIKPKRFELSEWANKKFLQHLFHHAFIKEEGSRQLVVVFHGFMEDHEDMMPLMKGLPLKEKTSWLFMDLPGHGKTPISAFSTRSDVFSLLTDFIHSFGSYDKVTFYGYSMGGRIALELSLHHLTPNELILESASFGAKSLEEKEKRFSSDQNLFKDDLHDMHTFFTQWYQNPIFYHYNQSMGFRADFEKKSQHDYREWKKSLDYLSLGAAAFLWKDNVHLARERSLKITVIYGQYDLKYKDLSLSLKKELPETALYEIESAGHNPHKTHLGDLKKILSHLL